MNQEICERIKPALLELLMEELSPQDRRQVKAHLETCRTCSQELAELRRAISLVARADLSAEMPRRIRLVTEPESWWAAFWRNPARLAFTAAGSLCVAVLVLSLFRTTIAYQNGNFQIAFGAPASSVPSPAAALPATAVRPALEQAQVHEMIAAAIGASERERQRHTEALAQQVSQRLEQRWRHDLGEMTESLRYFQAAQTMLYKGQVQNEQLVSALIQQSALPVQQPQ